MNGLLCPYLRVIKWFVGFFSCLVHKKCIMNNYVCYSKEMIKLAGSLLYQDCANPIKVSNPIKKCIWQALKPSQNLSKYKRLLHVQLDLFSVIRHDAWHLKITWEHSDHHYFPKD